MKHPRHSAAIAAFSLLAAIAPMHAAADAGVVAGERIDVSHWSAAREGESWFAAIRAGMPASEVLERLGEPDRRMRFERSRTTAWDYDYRDSWGYAAELSVVLDDAGRVVDTVRIRHDA
ncbi:MAG TPA: hypothetical protein VFJ86_09980 [Usitatibacter sp.]|jgi:hypothetical protein|nr:hypothetical protein [Usitatibacter sp.]